MKAVRLLTKVLTIIVLSVLLSGCSVGRDLLNDNEEQADHTDAELLSVGTNWKAVFNEVELLDSSFLTETTLLDDYLFVAHHSGMGQGNSLLYLGIECLLEQDTKDTLTGIVLDLPSGTIVQQLCVGSDKQLLVLAYEVKNDKTNHVLYTINVDDGSIEESKVINAWMDSLDKDLIVSLEKDNDGYVYLGDFYVNNNILVVDNEGKKAASLESNRAGHWKNF